MSASDFFTPVPPTWTPIRNGAPEVDPNGKAASDPGAKLDAGKNRLSLVIFGFARALRAVGEVATYGANKYSDGGWVDVPNGEARYTDALFRHLISEATGEARDADTGLFHAAHAAWNALARLDLALRSAEARGLLRPTGEDEKERTVCRSPNQGLA